MITAPTLDPRFAPYMPDTDRPKGGPPRLPMLGEPIAVRHSSGEWVRNYFAGFQANGVPFTVPRLPLGAGRFALGDRDGYGDGWRFPEEVRAKLGHFRAQCALPVVCDEHGLTDFVRYRAPIVPTAEELAEREEKLARIPSAMPFTLPESLNP